MNGIRKKSMACMSMSNWNVVFRNIVTLGLGLSFMYTLACLMELDVGIGVVIGIPNAFLLGLIMGLSYD